MVTRRCIGRTFLLTPGRILNRIITFLLAVACERHGVQVHAACVLSNHLHLVLTDVRGELPAFCQWFFKNLASCVNDLRNRREAVFAPNGYSRVTLVDENAVLEKIAYTLANPVAAALVEQGRQWPGVRLNPVRMKDPLEVRRPKVYFREEGKVPKKATLVLGRPRAFAGLSDEAYRELVAGVVAAKEKEARDKVRKEGRSFLGVEAVLAQDPFACPWTPEERRKMNPTVASHDRWRRAEALARNREWLEAYRKALEAFRAGKKDVEFPAGTYWMVRHAGARRVAPT
jgi:REP element-mobilizing transposase RayT